MGKTTIKNSMTWKLVGTSTGTNSTVTLPASWQELCIFVSGLNYSFTFNVPYHFVDIANRRLLHGYANAGAGSYWACEVGVTKTSCVMTTFAFNGQSSITPELQVYYR